MLYTIVGTDIENSLEKHVTELNKTDSEISSLRENSLTDIVQLFTASSNISKLKKEQSKLEENIRLNSPGDE